MVVAGASVVACSCVALTLAGMTGLALPAVGTLAVEVVHQVHTVAAIFAGVVSALIHIEVAQMPLPTVRTDALEGVDAIDACASILARISHTVVDVLVTVDPAEALVTGAGEVSSGITDAAAARSTHI